MRKPFRRLGEVVGGNRRQHAARNAAIERFGELEADRAEAGDGDAQRGFRTAGGGLGFGGGNNFHRVDLRLEWNYRLQAKGLLEVWIISARKANKREQRRYG